MEWNNEMASGQREKETSPENRRKTGEGNLARGETHRWKPGQSGNPGGRPRTAKLSEACRAKLGVLVPDDAEGRTYAEAIAEKLVQLDLKGDFRAAQELADRGEGRPSQMAPPAEQHGMKVVVIDVPRPHHGVWMPDIGPGDPLPPLPSDGSNGRKPQSETVFTIVRFFSAQVDSSLFYVGNLALAAGSLLRGTSLYGVGIGDAEE